MFNQKKEKIKKILKWLLIIVAIFLVITLLAVGFYFAFEKKHEGRIYPGVFIGDIDVSGLEMTQAKMILNQKVNQINQQGITISYENHQATLYPVFSSVGGDLAYEIINFDTEKNIEEAYLYARSNNFLVNLKQKIQSLFHSKVYPVKFSINELEVEKFLQENFSEFEKPAEDAKLIFENEKFSIKEESYGQKINFSPVTTELKNDLARPDNSPISLTSKIDLPLIFKSDCNQIEERAQKVMKRGPITLVFEKNSWQLSQKNLAQMLKIVIDFNAASPKKEVTLGLDAEKLKTFLDENIAEKVNQEPTEAKFEIKDGKVVEFQSSQDGRKINEESMTKKLEYELFQGCLANEEIECEQGDKKIEIVTTELKSQIQTDEVNDLGIKEIIGTGHSNFAGSPSNRRHNIAVGAAAVNGTLVKPDEEFSLLEVLGEVDAAAGYLPELVIKGNKTIPEYGGGLCQIGTTMFRATYESGMPVTLRRNHSYRVFYYEPAGTDATIYDPWPDYRFKNDSPYHILIQSRIEGDDLYFDFWSTEDGRVSTSTYPTIYNIVKPGPTKIVETLDLEPGKKKCTESSHNGADAYFDYTVTYPDGEVKEERFTSHYIPWQAVCLLGVEELSASSTEKVIEE